MDTVWIVIKNNIEFYKVCSNEATARYYCEELNEKDSANRYRYNEEMVRTFSENYINRERRR